MIEGLLEDLHKEFMRPIVRRRKRDKAHVAGHLFIGISHRMASLDEDLYHVHGAMRVAIAMSSA